LRRSDLFSCARARRLLLLVHRFGQVVMLALLGGQIAEQLPHHRIARLRDGRLVKIARLFLHGFHFTANHRHGQDFIDPKRLARDEALHVLTPDERDVLAEFLPVKLDQPVPMAILLIVHRLQRLGCGGIILPNTLCQIGVDSAILLLGLDGQREDLLRGKFLKRFGHGGWYESNTSAYNLVFVPGGTEVARPSPCRSSRKKLSSR
jgi:hypothetical protein